MNKYWKFVNHKEIEKEGAFGRDHYWYFNDAVSQEAETYMVRAVIKKGDGHDFHRHPEMNEILYILKGTAEQWVEDEMKILKPGDSVYIDPNLVHATFNAGEEDLEFLAVLAPATGYEGGTIDESGNLPYAAYRK
jgi:quercetin dioxygenase-like cupin family protein